MQKSRGRFEPGWNLQVALFVPSLDTGNASLAQHQVYYDRLEISSWTPCQSPSGSNQSDISRWFGYSSSTLSDANRLFILSVLILS